MKVKKSKWLVANINILEEISKRINREEIPMIDKHIYLKGRTFYIDKKGRYHEITNKLCTL